MWSVLNLVITKTTNNLTASKKVIKHAQEFIKRAYHMLF